MEKFPVGTHTTAGHWEDAIRTFEPGILGRLATQELLAHYYTHRYKAVMCTESSMVNEGESFSYILNGKVNIKLYEIRNSSF